MKPPWFVQVDGTEFGPLSETDLKNLIVQGVVKGASFLWRGDFENWIVAPTPAHLEALLGRYAQIHFDNEKPVLKRSLRHLPEGAERRREQRQPIVATAQIADPTTGRAIFATCEDISREGTQLTLCEPHAFARGQAISFRIVPVSLLKIQPMDFEGVIRWVHPAQTRIGVEFKPLSSETDKALGFYLKA